MQTYKELISAFSFVRLLPYHEESVWLEQPCNKSGNAIKQVTSC